MKSQKLCSSNLFCLCLRSNNILIIFFFLLCKEVMLQKDNFYVKDLDVSILLLSAVLLRKYNPGMNGTIVTAHNYISHRNPKNMCKL